MNRQQALHALAHELVAERAAAVVTLAEHGRMEDAPRVAERLRDVDAQVRQLAGQALWAIWSRSGDAAIDQLLARGVAEMGSGQLERAVATFGQVVKRKPAFAEGWNKRATALFLLGRDAESLRDCEEVLARNPLHFGALSGMTQIHLRRGDAERALQAYERALQANPNLEGGPVMLKLLQEAVARRAGNRT